MQCFLVKKIIVNINTKMENFKVEQTENSEVEKKNVWKQRLTQLNRNEC